MKITDAQIISGELSPDVSLEGAEELDFLNCSNLETAPNIPEGVKKINFSGCKNLKIVPTLPEGLEELDFSNCSKLENSPNISVGWWSWPYSQRNLKTTLTIPAGVKKIDFSWCINLKTVPTLPEGLEELNASYCSNLETVPNVPAGVKKLNFFRCTKLKNVPTLPEGVEDLNFSYCSKLETVPNIPAGVKKVDFSDCYNLKTVPTLPEGLEELSFYGCSALETATNIPAGVKKIDFSWCTDLKTVSNLPEGLREIDFSNCWKLETLPNIPSGVKRINLSHCSKLTISPSQLAQLFALEESGCVVSYPSQFNRNDQVAQAKSRLEEIGKKYKEANSLEAKEPIHSTATLLHRFLNESTSQRGGVKEVVLSTAPVLDILEKNPNHLKWVEEISAVFLDACVNQPVAGWSEISAWAVIAETEKMSEKLVAAKHLLVNDQIKNFVATTFLNHPEVEVEAGNTLLREIHKKLLDEGEILKPWAGIPGPVAYEGSVCGWLTKERVQKFHDKIKPILLMDPRQLAEVLLESVHCKTWGGVNFPEKLVEIEEDRRKRWTEIEEMPDGAKKEELVAGFEKANLEREMSEIKALTTEVLERELSQSKTGLVNRLRDQVGTAANAKTSPRAATRLNQALLHQVSDESGR